MEALAAVQSGRVRVHLPFALLVGGAVARVDLHRKNEDSPLGGSVLRGWSSLAFLNSLDDPICLL
jgi:hypothetical protein